ncbi:MAG: hypothetical protein IJT40_04165 [Firmicutes bacterium]|nr:hypothetical protein [Bacillota bacterium]
MKTVFIINPAAGAGNNFRELMRGISFLKAKQPEEISTYETRGVGDAEVFVRKTLDEFREDVLFVACGGDGTLNEVLNGTRGFSNAVISVYPSGTGNDFVRNFPEAGDFKDPTAITEGYEVLCDAIDLMGVMDGKYQTRLCANMINIGFDANVVAKTMDVKKKTPFSGSAAYLAAVAATLIKKKGADLRIVADGETLADGEILLTSLANGSYCGGGVKSNPYASLQDGTVDLSVIRNVSRTKFIKLFPKYQKGVHLDIPGIEDIITNLKAKDITVAPFNGTMTVSIDGEICHCQELGIKVIPGCFRFMVPAVK